MKLIRWLFPWMFEPEEAVCKCTHPIRGHPQKAGQRTLCLHPGCLCLSFAPCVSRAERRRHLAVVRKREKRGIQA